RPGCTAIGGAGEVAVRLVGVIRVCCSHAPHHVGRGSGDEVQKFITESNHGVLDYMVIANAKWWNGLPADVKKGLSQAMEESIAFGNHVALTEDDDFRAKVIADKKAAVVQLSAAQKQQWRTAMKPVWAQFEGEIGKDLIDAALQANEKPAPAKKEEAKSKHHSKK
ncbi:MAG: hypothetical protein ABL856_00660, partial [Gallionella sp.]